MVQVKPIWPWTEFWKMVGSTYSRAPAAESLASEAAMARSPWQPAQTSSCARALDDATSAAQTAARGQIDER